MASTLRAAFIGSAVAQAGTTFTHGLSVEGSAVTPDWFHFHHSGAPPAPQANTLYFVSRTNTSFTLASASGATTANVFLEYQHSLNRGTLT